jgi:hypothetical protein
MASQGYLSDPLCWLRSGCTEDVMMGIYARAVGMDMADHNGPGEPFGVQFSGLPYSPDILLARGYSIVHSVKDQGELREADTRQFFRSFRQAQVPTSVAVLGDDL